MSVPSSKLVNPHATAAAGPPDDPPGHPRRVPRVVRRAEDLVVGLEVAGPPRDVRLAEHDARPPPSAGPPRRRRGRERGRSAPTAPPVERTPSTSMASLIVIGSPCNGPVDSPRAVAASAASAAARARSTSSVTTALTAGLRRSIRSRYRSSSSRLLTSLAAIAAANRLAVHVADGRVHVASSCRARSPYPPCAIPASRRCATGHGPGTFRALR